jgi:hypothetical protein
VTLHRRIGAALREQSMLLSSAGLLAIATGATSALGFAFWWLAARTASPASVGTAAADISLMTFIAQLGEMGLGALLMGEARRLKPPGPAVAAAALIAFTVAAFFAAVYVAVSGFVFDRPRDLGGWFTFGAGLTAACAVVDQALWGLLRSRIAAARTIACSVIKLAMLAGAAVALPVLGPLVFLAAWIAAQAVSIGLMAAASAESRSLIFSQGDLAWVRTRVGPTIAHHCLNLANLAPVLLLPVVVANLLAPSTNAAFYVGWTLMTAVFAAPGSLAGMIYAVGSAHPRELAAKLRTSFALASGLAVGVAVGSALAAAPILSFFSPFYAEVAASSFALLGLSVMPMTMKCHYIAVQRIDGRMLMASAVLGLGCLLELGGAIAGGLYGGLFGLTAGWLGGLVLEAVIMAPPVVRALLAGAGDSFARTAIVSVRRVEGVAEAGL